MALAAGPLTPIKERGEGADGEGGSGDDQQDKGEVWEGTEPLGGTASGDTTCKVASCIQMLTLKLFLYLLCLCLQWLNGDGFWQLS